MYSPEELRRKRRAEVRKLKQAEVAAKKNGDGEQGVASGNGKKKKR
jgi:hypothetical protein